MDRANRALQLFEPQFEQPASKRTRQLEPEAQRIADPSERREQELGARDVSRKVGGDASKCRLGVACGDAA